MPDGVLSVPVLAGGALICAAGLAYGLRRIEDAALPRVAVVSALFFVASLIAVPVGPTSAHLMLSGLMGLVLGWAAVPAVFVGLALQAVLFGVGGLTTLGVNTAIIALPGIVFALAFSPLLRRASGPGAGLVAALVSLCAVLGTAGLVVLVLALTDPAYLAAAPLVLAAYLPLLAAEAVVSGFAVAFLVRVMPEALAGGARA